MQRAPDETDAGAAQNSTSALEQIEGQVAWLRERLGWLEQHHGDALTDVVRRVNAIEESHGGALVALGERLQQLAASSATSPSPEQPAAAVRGDRLALPPGTFLGDVPARYGSEIARYRAQGGRFDPSANAITYGHGDMVRFYFLSMAFDLILKEGLAGSVIELGVWKGDTAALLADFARRAGKQLYLLDTFEGFDERDLEDSEKHLSKRFSETSVDYVRRRTGSENVSFVQGYFPETAAQMPDQERYCLVHIDTDLYAPIKAGLEYFYDRVVPGGFIIVHDYMSLCWDGAIRAVDEFFADKPEAIIPIPDLAGTVAVRKTR